MGTITITELRNLGVNTWSVKDDSTRGYTTKSVGEVKIGDKVVMNNHFVSVVDSITICLSEGVQIQKCYNGYKVLTQDPFTAVDGMVEFRERVYGAICNLHDDAVDGGITDRDVVFSNVRLFLAELEVQMRNGCLFGTSAVLGRMDGLGGPIPE